MKSSHSTARGTEEIRKQLAELWTSVNKSNLDEKISLGTRHLNDFQNLMAKLYSQEYLKKTKKECLKFETQ